MAVWEERGAVWCAPRQGIRTIGDGAGDSEDSGGWLMAMAAGVPKLSYTYVCSSSSSHTPRRSVCKCG